MMCVFLNVVLFFFFKQKTAYEMRISDWSSDVCSSDLNAGHAHERGPDPRRSQSRGRAAIGGLSRLAACRAGDGGSGGAHAAPSRRLGPSQCRTRRASKAQAGGLWRGRQNNETASAMAAAMGSPSGRTLQMSEQRVGTKDRPTSK